MTGLVANTDGGVLRLELARPDKLNAFTTPLLTELRHQLAIAAAADDIRVVVITGQGRLFSAGGDLSGHDTAGAVQVANEVIAAITALPKPVIAGVHGPAVGMGCSLALACDMMVVARSVYFQLAFVRVGLMPDAAASLLLPVAIGRARAARLAMTGEKFSAAEAFEFGLVSHLCDDEDYPAVLGELVQSLAQGPTRAYGWIKRALAAATLPRLSEITDIEERGQATLVRSEDYREGRNAFAARRSPLFTGR